MAIIILAIILNISYGLDDNTPPSITNVSWIPKYGLKLFIVMKEHVS